MPEPNITAMFLSSFTISSISWFVLCFVCFVLYDRLRLLLVATLSLLVQATFASRRQRQCRHITNCRWWSSALSRRRAVQSLP